jgi:tRNA threonylcarbamoyl adenosine modification protein YeaZ
VKPGARIVDTVIVLAIDTATPAVTAGVVRLDPVVTLAARVTVDARAHGELLMPHVTAALAEAGVGFEQVDAIVCGTGPGPFTGLRVGMVTAASLGHALGVPVHGVCTLDAIAHDAATGPLLVLTDARRREVYWAHYDSHGRRLAGPRVQAPADLPELEFVAVAGQGARLYDLGVPVVDYPSPAGLVAVAAAHLRAGDAPEPFLPLYLRRPDAVVPGTRKKVGA